MASSNVRIPLIDMMNCSSLVLCGSSLHTQPFYTCSFSRGGKYSPLVLHTIANESPAGVLNGGWIFGGRTGPGVSALDSSSFPFFHSPVTLPFSSPEPITQASDGRAHSIWRQLR